MVWEVETLTSIHQNDEQPLIIGWKVSSDAHSTTMNSWFVKITSGEEEGSQNTPEGEWEKIGGWGFYMTLKGWRFMVQRIRHAIWRQKFLSQFKIQK